MNPRIPDDLPYQPDDMNIVVRRMGAAGWLAENKTSIVCREDLTLYYSEKGILKMRELGDILKHHAPGLFDPSIGKTNHAGAFKLVFKSFVAAGELMPLTEKESWAFMALVAGYALKNQGPTGQR